MKKLLLALLLVPAINASHPILKDIHSSHSTTNDAICKRTAGALLGFIATDLGWRGMNAYCNLISFQPNQPFNFKKKAPLLWLASCCLGSAIGYSILDESTPDYKFQEAKELLKGLDKEFIELIQNSHKNKKEFYKNIQGWFFGYQYPFWQATKVMKNYYQTLEETKKLLLEVQHNDAFAGSSTRLLADIKELQFDIREVALMVKASPDWVEETKKAHQNEENKKQQNLQKQTQWAEEDRAQRYKQR